MCFSGLLQNRLASIKATLRILMQVERRGPTRWRPQEMLYAVMQEQDKHQEKRLSCW
jgi:hypothetical protein